MSGDESQITESRGRTGAKVFLIVLPLWLVASTVVGVWLWHRGQQNQAEFEPEKFRLAISEDGLESDLEKLVEIAGPRNVETKIGQVGLRRAAAMIEGSLGQSNAGYRLITRRVSDLGPWPVVLATLPGDDRRPIAVLAAYDADPTGGGVEANATGVASVLAVAQSLAGQPVGRPIIFTFIPHGYEPDSPALPALQVLNEELGDVEVLLVVEAMGAADRLIASSRELEVLPKVEGMATIVGAESICLQEDTDLSAVLFEQGQPAVRISTRRVVSADEPDDNLPIAGVHAAATLKLQNLVRKLATDP